MNELTDWAANWLTFWLQIFGGLAVGGVLVGAVWLLWTAALWVYDTLDDWWYDRGKR